MTDWPIKTLGDLITVQNGYAFDSEFFSSHGKIGLIRIRDLKNGTDTETCYEGPYDADYVVSAGDYLIGMDGEFRCYEWQGEPALLNQRVCRLREFDKSLEPRFLFYGINKFLKDIEDVTGYTTVKHLSSKSILAIEMPVPPLQEQKRIVALLDAATARVTELTACYEQARTHANNLFTSSLRDALERNSDWPVKTLGEVSSVKGGKRLPKGTPWSSVMTDHPYIRATDIREGEIRTDDLVFVPEEIWPAISRYVVQEGDVLITIAGTIGSIAVVPKVLAQANLTENAAKITDLVGLESSYLSYFLRSGEVRDRLQNLATTTTQAKLALFRIESLEIPVPPLAEQKRIVAQMDSMKAKTSEMVAAYDAKVTAAKNLRQSILESAFAGDL